MDTRLLDAFVDGLTLGFEIGVDVELDDLMLEGWTWARDDQGYVVRGPRGTNWLPRVGLLARRLGYLNGQVLRCLGEERVELHTWRRSGFAFRVVFLAE